MINPDRIHTIHIYHFRILVKQSSHGWGGKGHYVHQTIISVVRNDDLHLTMLLQLFEIFQQVVDITDTSRLHWKKNGDIRIKPKTISVSISILETWRKLIAIFLILQSWETKTKTDPHRCINTAVVRCY